MQLNSSFEFEMSGNMRNFVHRTKHKFDTNHVEIYNVTFKPRIVSQVDY